MSHIFISHVAEDRDIAEGIAKDLESASYRTWLYERDAVVGIAHLTQTARAIETADAYLLIVSAQTLTSLQVETELVHAHESDKKVFPILVDISFDTLKAKRPMWAVAIRAAVALVARRDSVGRMTADLLKGLRGAGVTPDASTRHTMQFRFATWKQEPDGAFVPKRLVAHDIDVSCEDGNLTVSAAAKRGLQAILRGTGSLTTGDKVSTWYLDGRPIPDTERVLDIPSGTVVVVFLDTLSFPDMVRMALSSARSIW